MDKYYIVTDLERDDYGWVLTNADGELGEAAHEIYLWDDMTGSTLLLPRRSVVEISKGQYERIIDADCDPEVIEKVMEELKIA